MPTKTIIAVCFLKINEVQTLVGCSGKVKWLPYSTSLINKIKEWFVCF